MSQKKHSESTPSPVIGTAPAQAKPKSKLKAERIQSMLRKTPGWELTPDRQAITRSYRFPVLPAAVAFAAMANHLGSGDHPVQVVQLGNAVTCRLTSPWVNGLTKLDFNLARQINLQG
jgi:pterin-4a-carbinolamine dehydratase